MTRTRHCLAEILRSTARYRDLIEEGATVTNTRTGAIVRDKSGKVIEHYTLAPHLLPCSDADAWHRERQAGRPIGLALFDHEPDTQGKLL